MRINKLQKFKQILRKTSIFFLVAGLLLTSQGVYQATSNNVVYASYFEPDCAPPNGTGPRIEGIVAAGAEKVGTAGTSYRVKNCGNQTHTITAQRFSGKCDGQTGNCFPQRIEDQTLTLASGEYKYFTVDSPNISCGSAQTDIQPQGLSSAGTYAQIGQPCKHDTPAPTPTVTPAPAAPACQSLSTSVTQINSQTTITLTAVASTNATSFTYALYNPDNLRGPNDPKQIMYTAGTPAVFTQATSASNTNTITLTGAQLAKPDLNWNNQIPKHVQINAYFSNASGASNSNSNCVVTLNISTPAPIPDQPLPTNTPTPSPTVTATPIITPVPTSVVTTTPIPTPTATVFVPTPIPDQPLPTNTPTPTVTASPSPTSSPSTTQLKLCKYEDDNANGIVDNAENIISWTFNYTYDGGTHTVDSHWWDNLLNQGCANVTVPADKSITVAEVLKSGWRMTGLYSDGAKVDTETLTYTSNANATKTIWFLNTFTPNVSPSPTITASPSPTNTATPTATAQPSATATPTATVTPTTTAAPTNTAAPTTTAVPTSTATASPTTTASPAVLTSQLKICKYEDTNNNGTIDNGEGTIDWRFNYTANNQTTTVQRSWWDNLFNQGCLITTVPANQTISVNEETKAGWTQTALFADGAKTDTANYSYTSSRDNVKILWFLNNHTSSSTTPSPTATITASPSPSPTASPIGTVVVTNTGISNLTIEKRVDGTRVDGTTVGIQYRVKIKNTSSSNVNNLQIRDTLAPDFKYDDNTTEGDITKNPTIQDVSTSGDKRRLIWDNISIDAGKEINFGYRTTGKRNDTNYCNSAEIRQNDIIISTSQACVTINSAAGTQVLAASSRVLPETGTNPAIIIGTLLVGLSAFGWKLSRHVE